MAQVIRDPRDGRWLARWRDPSGHQRNRSFTRKADAQRWLDQALSDLHRGRYIDPAAAKAMTGDYAIQWASGLAHLKVSTATRYRGIVRELKNQKLRSGIERLANWILRRDVESGGTGKFTLSASAMVPGPALVTIKSAALMKSGRSWVKP